MLHTKILEEKITHLSGAIFSAKEKTGLEKYSLHYIHPPYCML